MSFSRLRGHRVPFGKVSTKPGQARTPAVQRKIEAAAAETPFLSSSQKLSRSNDRRRRPRLKANESSSGVEE
jgi:hypothetical protein